MFKCASKTKNSLNSASGDGKFIEKRVHRSGGSSYIYTATKWALMTTERLDTFLSGI